MGRTGPSTAVSHASPNISPCWVWRVRLRLEPATVSYILLLAKKVTDKGVSGAASVVFHVSPPPVIGMPYLSSFSPANSFNLEIIQDLCSTFTSPSHLGFCLDLASQGVLLGTYLAAQRSVMLGHNMVTLEDILMTQ